MARGSLRRYDVQARFSLMISAAALLPWLVAAFASLTRYNHELRAIQYGRGGLYKLGFLGCIGLAVLLSGIGVTLGFNSAGQRRNDQPGKSWAGFLLGLGTLSLSIVLLYAFRSLGFEVEVG